MEFNAFQGFFKAKYHHFFTPNMEYGIMIKIVVIFSHKLFCSYYDLSKTNEPQYILTKNNSNPQNHFSRLFKILFSNSRLVKALKTIFIIQGYSGVFKSCANPDYAAVWNISLGSHGKILIHNWVMTVDMDWACVFYNVIYVLCVRWFSWSISPCYV